MMGTIWAVLLVALAGSHLGHSSPLRSTPQTYPHDGHRPLEGWRLESGWYAAVPALAFVVTAVGLLIGCTWCYRNKDCKPNEGADNQLFTASVTHLHDGRRSQPPDSGFSEPVNNNISEDNNNGPISLREMQNIANNNAAAYIVTENEERNRVSRESVVEFEPLPTGIRVVDPLEHCADWFSDDDFPRNRLQYLREISRGWFGRVVEGEIEEAGASSSVAVKILNQNASLEDKARFLDEAKMLRDVRHENVLAFVAKCLQEEPWILLFELCPMDLQQYLVMNRPKMAILNESGVPLRLMCDVTAALDHLHSRGYLYGNIWCGAVLVRGSDENVRAVLGRYTASEPPYDFSAPETRTHPPVYTASSDLWSLGTLVWEVCAWGASPTRHPPPLPELPCPYRNHLYQVMQLCWQPDSAARGSSHDILALLQHLRGQHSPDFEQRWQRLKPNTIPTRDEHRAIVHAPTNMPELSNVHAQESLSLHMDSAVSRSSSIMSDTDPLSLQIKSESLTNLHGSLDDVRNIYLTHNETAVLDCHQGNISLDAREKEQDRSDTSMDPWLKDIIAGSQDDVRYYKDVSDVIKNLDNMLNSEKTSSSESSHQASPSRDNLSLDCKKEYPVQSSMVKSPGITNFQNILDMGFSTTEEDQTCENDEMDRDTIGTLSHSFERHSEVDTISQHTLENLTPETPVKDMDNAAYEDIEVEVDQPKDNIVDNIQDTVLPNEIVNSVSEIAKLKELCVASIPSTSDELNIRKDCQTSCDSNILRTDIKDETKSIDDVVKNNNAPQQVENKESIVDLSTEIVENVVLPKSLEQITANMQEFHQNFSDIEDRSIEGESITNDVSVTEVLVSDLIKEIPEDNSSERNILEENFNDLESIQTSKSDHKNINENSNIKFEETETTIVFENEKSKPLPPEIVQNNFKNLNDTEKEMPSAIAIEDNNFSNECVVSGIDKDSDRNKIRYDRSLSEEHSSLDESKTVSVVCEYTKWINSASDPHSSQYISDFIQSERRHTVLNKDDVPNTCDFKRESDNFQELTTEKHPSSITDTELANDIPESSKTYPADPTLTASLPSMSEIITEDVNTVHSVVKSVSSPEFKLFPITHDISNAVDVATINTVEHIIQQKKDSESIENNKDLLLENEPIVTENSNVLFTVSPRSVITNENGFAGQNKNICIEIENDNFKTDIQVTDYATEAVCNEVDLTPHSQSTTTKTELNDPSNVDLEHSIDNVHTEAEKIYTELDFPTKVSEIPVNEMCISKQITSDQESFKVSTPTEDVFKIPSDNSTVYMNLINDTNIDIPNSSTGNNVHDVIHACLETSDGQNEYSLMKNESTEYLDLPSFGIHEVDKFLHIERVFSSCNEDVVSSTPIASDTSTLANNTTEKSVQENYENIPNYGPGVTLTKLEQKCVPDSLSPFESPSKSHPTDTYDENSSVVLGPFENCSLELFKAVKSSELVDFPKEELLAFSSNFSEMNLETPSPLRDGNFLNEVPELTQDDIQFDNIESISDKPPSDPTETDSGNSATEKRISPSTPPNSPGVFLASTSQKKYLVDIDLTTPPTLPEPDVSLQNEIELNQIELQITSKLAMAENENNMNIEYSGPLTVEGLVSDDEVMLLRDSDSLPESYLAGNGGAMDDLRENLILDEDCVKALRNELELKLPLAQVAAIEPSCDSEWSTELPPPPELVVNYPGALSPIAEETGQQLSAYENDAQWNVSIRTDSSESYPEPCNNSTDEVTELPTGAQSGPQENSTCIIDSGGQSRDHSLNHTYTLHKEQIDIASSRELTMSADSLNASQFKKAMPDVNSPIDDKTYTKEEEKESLERISQISPFLVSPTTDSSAPDNSDNFDNATGVSTLSKTTLPTDAKISKPAETQCLSKATSIDSWCSNDTLYNVEENFDDLALDPDVPDFQSEKEEGNSESTDTLNHNEDEKEASHCSTYIIHDSKSEACESFSPDSITANDNYTYTKAKTDYAGTTPSVVTAELNDSTKNTQTKDLAYGTLMSGLPSYSNCTTELASDCNDWKLQQPEWTRKSPLPDNPSITPPNMKSHEKVADVSSPRLETEPTLNKMESVDISCLQNNVIDFENKMEVSETQGLLVQMDSPNQGYKNMTPSVTSTPLVDLIEDPEVEVIPMALPGVSENTNDSVNVLNFQAFLQSAEVRPQDLSSNASNELNHDTGVLLEGDSKTLSRNSNKNSLAIAERTPTYSDFENSAVSKPQDINARENSQSCESGISSEDFQKFRSSVSSRPQDLSSLIDASSLLLKSERVSSEIAMGSTPSYCYLEQTSQEKSEESRMSPPNLTNLKESHSLVNFREPNFLLNFDADDEMEQPHSIIITESTMEAFKESSSRPNKPNQNDLERNQSCDLHSYKAQNNDNFEILEKQTKEDISLPKIDNVTETAVSPEINSVAHSSVITNFKEKPYAYLPNHNIQDPDKINNDSEKFATVNFLSETFEELIESNVDDGETKEHESEDNVENLKPESTIEPIDSPKQCKSIMDEIQEADGVINGQGNADSKLTTVTQDFLHNEKKFCQLGTYLPMLSDIRFTGPASEIMSTSFTQESPSDPTSGECGRVAADIIKEWDSDTDSHTSNSSSGEFIWKQRTTEQQDNSNTQRGGSQERGEGSGASDASGDSGSGSEGDEVEFVPSSWDCRAAPAKSSLRSLEQATPDNKKRVVFKRQKYHCVYEYPREACDVEAHSPAAYLPDFSTYSEWDPSSAEEAELGYGQLFGAPSPLDLYPLRAGIAFGADYDQDFFISSSARPFESLGIMTSQFFPGKHLKPSLLEQDLSDEVAEEFPPPPSPLSTTTLMQTRSPSLDFTTPDSGVEDITPGSTIDEDFKKKLPEPELTWRPVDSGSSSESVSPSSPGGEALGGLRHTRDKLKLDLPPSPHIPSPRHNRVFSFVLDKPKRREERTEIGTTPLVMTDDTPIVTTSLPLQKECEELPVPEPTFSTFGKSTPKSEPEQKLILTDDLDENTVEVKDESPSPKVVEPVKGEGTVLDSGDEDSGIESSSKATLERKTNVS